MADSRDTGLTLDPKWNADGLITAVVSGPDGALLMVAHMNRAALDETLASGDAVFWSRSRQALWRKGETSGHTMRVREAWIDCDQDAVWLIVDAAGPACHTGERSCFFRRIVGGGLEQVG